MNHTDALALHDFDPGLIRDHGIPLADFECAHGRLAADDTPACGCHVREPTSPERKSGEAPTGAAR